MGCFNNIKRKILKKGIESEENTTVEEFRAELTRTLKILSKYTEAYINGKNRNVQPMKSK